MRVLNVKDVSEVQYLFGKGIHVEHENGYSETISIADKGVVRLFNHEKHFPKKPQGIFYKRKVDIGRRKREENSKNT